MHSPLWLPAGVPPGLSRLRAHIAAFLAGAPLLFLGVVLGIAVVFRVALGAVKPAVAAEEAAPVAATPASSAAARAEPRPAVEVGGSPSPAPAREPRPPSRGRGKSHRR